MNTLDNDIKTDTVTSRLTLKEKEAFQALAIENKVTRSEMIAGMVRSVLGLKEEAKEEEKFFDKAVVIPPTKEEIEYKIEQSRMKLDYIKKEERNFIQNEIDGSDFNKDLVLVSDSVLDGNSYETFLSDDNAYMEKITIHLGENEEVSYSFDEIGTLQKILRVENIRI